MSRFQAAVIGGTHSGVGKTTWFLALAGLFRKEGLEVQPFKVGPDYIDPGFHNWVCRPRKARNLDRFFLSEKSLQRTFEESSKDADLALMEGVMGLFDGKSVHTEEGSTAQMAKLLGVPVFLVIDGAGLARSAAALVKGYQSFDPNLELRGVFINRIASEGHFRWLKEPIEKETGIPVLGWLPPDPAIAIPERHLGLRTALEERLIQEKVNRLADSLSRNFDKTRFLGLCKTVVARSPEQKKTREPFQEISCRIGVAYDRAFSFYYEDNFDLLRERGAELVFFSPLEEGELPENLDALYLGGGFPEIYVEPLSRNEGMKAAIRTFHREGGLIYAECGGLMYLAERFLDSQGETLPLVGLIPGRIRMTDRLQHFGYHEIETSLATFLFPQGKKLRSHEFHYSVWEVEPRNFLLPYQIGERGEGFFDGQIVASYQHLHFGQEGELAKNFVRGADERRRKYAYPR